MSPLATRIFRPLSFFAALLLLACARPRLSKLPGEEISALELRHYQVHPRRAFDAAERWLLGSGWGIVYSDRSSGVIRTDWRTIPPVLLAAELAKEAKKPEARRKLWVSVKALPNTQVALRLQILEEFRRDGKARWVEVDLSRRLARREYEALHESLKDALLPPPPAQVPPPKR